MPTLVTASEGDTLCGLAIAAGFLDCQPLRDDGANSDFLNRDLKAGDIVTIPDLAFKEESKKSETTSVFELKSAPPVLVRFTHGSPDKPYREDDSLTFLNVSNIATNKGGAKGDQPFPSKTPFNQAGHDDPDAFKIEVVDPGGPKTVKVLLEAMKPKFAPDGSISGHELFAAGKEHDDRMLEATCEQVPSAVCYRSPYLRLVVDPQDKAAVPKQTLLTTDLADGAEGDKDKIEIIDQQVRVSYVREKCPAAAPNKCTVRAQLPIGQDHKRAKVMAHILQDASGTPVTTKPLTRKRILNYVRQLYAQADMTVKIVAAIQEVPLPANLIAIANANGRRAVGGKTIGIRVRIDGAFDQTVTITTTLNAKPIDTANTLAAEILKVVPPGTKVEASENPPVSGQAIGSADVLVGKPLTQKIQLDITANNDTRHPVKIGQLSTTTVPEFGGTDSHVGTIEERVLVKNYDTGSDRIDLFIVNKLGSGSLGEAFTPNFKSAGNQQPKALMVNSALVFADTVRKDDHFHTTIPHEMGHILMDCSHATVATEMMGAGSPVGKNERVVKGPKRISDPRKISFDNAVTDVPVTMLRTANATLVE